ncbi:MULTISPECIES: thioredoxin domain-containing protein [Hydrocarboniphaga]|jgi:thiol-disulfide isomerase/thioredoxin|uniref:Thioredoxin domain-containing protein n=1 Tax=Hydrocarboniphaga effusa AP103 TaxID=1172194 RepID=I7Z8M8_9GAMM|nr:MULTISPECIES: thioredoxin domain-containing protein [Hydrocarboniphaga]EIT68179.1 hypothetical protein WQQ_46140 [Hydrocarboniphaga effusa AP103]MDZ4078274.1 thioredoxin domain-containing protein [Hydrocarboniphaga sp.]
MQMRMRLITITTLTLILGLAGLARAADNKPLPTKPMAVWFYADWCMNCKLIAPKIAEVKPDFERSVEFVRLDVTNEERKAKSREQAQKLGLYSLYMSNKATGWLALIDSSGNKVGELHQEMTVDQIRKELSKIALPTSTPATPDSAAPVEGLSP